MIPVDIPVRYDFNSEENSPLSFRKLKDNGFRIITLDSKIEQVITKGREVFITDKYLARFNENRDRFLGEKNKIFEFDNRIE